MAYEPKEWVCGETITADGLNHLEQGLADCCGESELFIVNVTKKLSGNPTADKTFAEIKDAYDSGKIVICRLNMQTVPSDTMPMNTSDCAMSYFWQSNSFGALWATVDLFNTRQQLYVNEVVIDANGVSYDAQNYVLTEFN